MERDPPSAVGGRPGEGPRSDTDPPPRRSGFGFSIDWKPAIGAAILGLGALIAALVEGR